jgi:hypothetical protein
VRQLRHVMERSRLESWEEGVLKQRASNVSEEINRDCNASIGLERTGVLWKMKRPAEGSAAVMCVGVS